MTHFEKSKTRHTQIFRVVWAHLLATLISSVCGCSPVPSNWHLSDIPEDRGTLHSQRLVYESHDCSNTICLEFFLSNDEPTGYLCSLGRRFVGSPTVYGSFRLGADIVEASLEVHEGGMRARLPDTLTKKIVQTLQEGQPITIIVDSLEQTIEPGQFPYLYTNHFKNRLFERIRASGVNVLK